MTDQIRRPSQSMGANLAEAWQKRRYESHFVSKLSDVDVEQAKTRHWLDTALACHYITPGNPRRPTFLLPGYRPYDRQHDQKPTPPSAANSKKKNPPPALRHNNHRRP